MPAPKPIRSQLYREMSRHMDFIGQRADQFTVVGLGERHNGIIAKEVEHYTITCEECENGVGYYDDIGEIICDSCGMVLSGSSDPVLSTEYAGDGETIGASRGVEKMGGEEGSMRPSVQ